MKKFLFAIMAAAALIACNKDDDPKPEPEEEGEAVIELVVTKNTWLSKNYGYQILLDPTCTANPTSVQALDDQYDEYYDFLCFYPDVPAYGNTSPLAATIYAKYEYRVPENASDNATTPNSLTTKAAQDAPDGAGIVSASVTIPAGTYDYAVVYPNKNLGVLIPSDVDNGTIVANAVGKSYEFKKGHKYTIKCDAADGPVYWPIPSVTITETLID